MKKLGGKLQEVFGKHKSGSKNPSADSQDPRKHHNPAGTAPNKQDDKLRGVEDGHGKIQTPSQDALKSDSPLALPPGMLPLEERSTPTEVTSRGFSPRHVPPYSPFLRVKILRLVLK